MLRQLFDTVNGKHKKSKKIATDSNYLRCHALLTALHFPLEILANGKGHFGPTDRNDQTGHSGPLSKLVPNIPVGPNRNGPFHLMYQPKLPEFWVEWKAPNELCTTIIDHFDINRVGKFYIIFDRFSRDFRVFSWTQSGE